MISCLPINIALIQPAGHIESLALLDPARYLRHLLRGYGIEPSITKNRVHSGALNLILGAHLDFPSEWRSSYACIIVNLVQIDRLEPSSQARYIELLKSIPSIDAYAGEASKYSDPALCGPGVDWIHAKYLEPAISIPLEQRGIDLLFIGKMNERRRRMLDRIESKGISVATFDKPIYAAERDQLITSAKAVINIHLEDDSRFEHIRAHTCLSLGTPVISETSRTAEPPRCFDEAVTWIEASGIEDYFLSEFGTEKFFTKARNQVAMWQNPSIKQSINDSLLVDFFQTIYTASHEKHPPGTWHPEKINLGSGKDYKPGWLNIDVLERAEPDLVLNLAAQQSYPIRGLTRFGRKVEIAEGSVKKIYANNVLEHVQDLPALMTNALAILADSGEFEIEVPYQDSLTAWQDPTHVRAMNENSWLYYTDWFWYLGWFTHRFEIIHSQWLDLALRPCSKDSAAFMRVILKKTETTLYERTIARTMQVDLRIPHDQT